MIFIQLVYLNRQICLIMCSIENPQLVISFTRFMQTPNIYTKFRCFGVWRCIIIAELLNTVDICEQISKQTQAPAVLNTTFYNIIITSTIVITRLVTVAILITFRPAHLPQLSGCDSCIFDMYMFKEHSPPTTFCVNPSINDIN